MVPKQGPEAQGGEAPEDHRSSKTPWKAYVGTGWRGDIMDTIMVLHETKAD